MEISKVKEIVARLLERTVKNGCTEGEAASAIAKAHELLAKYGLSVSDINAEEESIVEQKVDTDTKSLSAIQVHIALSLQKYFGVELVRTQSGTSSSLKVIGEKIKADIFTETFLFAYKAFKYNWSKYNKTLDCSTAEKNLHRGAYLRGFCDGFTNEIIRQENESALVVVKSEALQKHMSEMGPMSHRSYTNKTSGDAVAYSTGYESGSFTQRGKNKSIQD